MNSKRRAACREQGFSLLEMAVVLALVTTCLLLAAGLFQESAKVMKAAQGELGNPLAGLTSDRLRADLQGAWGLLSTSPTWSRGPLMLLGPDGVVVYQRDGGELVRSVVDAEGKVDGREAWIKSLISWRWQTTGTNVVEVEILYGKAPDLGRFRLDEAPGRPPPTLVEERLLIALRGGGRERGW